MPLLLTVAIAFAKEGCGRAICLEKDNHIHIGFCKGRQWLNVNNIGFRQHKYTSAASTGLLFRMPLVHHFKLEAGLLYNNVINPGTTTGSLLKRTPIVQSAFVTAPVTVQYFFRPETAKLRPFIGMGTMISPFQQKAGMYNPGNDSYMRSNNNKYFSLLFTQGFTYAISTKIDVTEAIHIMPDKDNTAIGFSVGIGFRVP